MFISFNLHCLPIRIGLTVVKNTWLLECYEKKRRVPLRNHLVGQSIVSVDHQFEDEDEEILCSQPHNPIPAEMSKGCAYHYCKEKQSFYRISL